MYKADLHLHTTSSDGLLSPKELVEWAAKKKLSAVAVTDHDTISGVAEAKIEGEKRGIEVIPGIELSCTYRDEEIHILGYFIDIESDILNDKIRTLKESRENRGCKIVEKLKSTGIDISIEEVMEKVKGGAFGRPHIARVLVDKGIAKSTEEAFNRFLVKGRAGYVERYKLTVEEAINLIHAAGGVAVMAHPGIIKNKNYSKEILRFGFDGIEAVHSLHNSDTVKKYEKLADSLGLIKTAGSDCHGVMEKNGPIMGDFTVGLEAIEKLKAKRDKIRQEADKNG